MTQGNRAGKKLPVKILGILAVGFLMSSLFVGSLPEADARQINCNQHMSGVYRCNPQPIVAGDNAKVKTLKVHKLGSCIFEIGWINQSTGTTITGTISSIEPRTALACAALGFVVGTPVLIAHFPR